MKLPTKNIIIVYYRNGCKIYHYCELSNTLFLNEGEQLVYYYEECGKGVDQLSQNDYTYGLETLNRCRLTYNETAT